MYMCNMFLIIDCVFRIVRLDSPNLNYLIISGVIIIYLCGILLVVPTLVGSVVSSLCIVSTACTFILTICNYYNIML